MPLRLYNTRTRKVESFKPSTDGKVSLYTCGPTVYDFAHIGNFRTFCAQDLLRRHLIQLGYAVNHVMNLTDVDDKTIKRSRTEQKPLQEITTRFTTAFLEDLSTLRCLTPTTLCNATDVVPEIIAMIETLLKKKHAYVGEDGSVYFSVKSFNDYGKLARLEKVQLKAGARVAQDEYDKAAAADFALWKAHTPDDGDVHWDSPWGKGRPGWHIECSAIATKFLGPRIDIHAGGIDLLFPHHQNEVAQSECCFGQKPFVKYWFHPFHILVEGKKMSKSLGNFFTLRDIAIKDFRALRFFYLLSHYRSEANFTLSGLKEAEKSIRKLDDWVDRLQAITTSPAAKPLRMKPLIARWHKQFLHDLNDDLNTPEAIKHLFEMVHETNRLMEEGLMDQPSAQAVLVFLATLNETFPIFHFGQTNDLPAAIMALVAKREEARRARNWNLSDRLRDDIARQGFEVLDTPQGPRVKKKD